MNFMIAVLQSGRTVLLLATEASRLDVVKWLVEKGANMEAEDNVSPCLSCFARVDLHSEVDSVLLDEHVRSGQSMAGWCVSSSIGECCRF